MRLRRGTLIFIYAFLALQMAIPVSYYLTRSDRNDERFAWRMFSPTRGLRCAPTFVLVDGETQRPVPIPLVGRETSLGHFQPAEFHEAWVALARRGRGAVIDAMATEACRRNPGREVRVHVACREIDGESYLLRDGTSNACPTGTP